MLDQLDLNAVKRLYRADLPVPVEGVRKFEASFTHSPDALDALRGSKWVLAVHFHEAPDAIRSIVKVAGGELVYQSNETSPIVIAKRFHPANTNPLVFKRTCLFRFEDQQSCEAAMQPVVFGTAKGGRRRGVRPAL
jgi:hypothetical protein